MSNQQKFFFQSVGVFFNTYGIVTLFFCILSILLNIMRWKSNNDSINIVLSLILGFAFIVSFIIKFLYKQYGLSHTIMSTTFLLYTFYIVIFSAYYNILSIILIIFSILSFIVNVDASFESKKVFVFSAISIYFLLSIFQTFQIFPTDKTEIEKDFFAFLVQFFYFFGACFCGYMISQSSRIFEE